MFDVFTEQIEVQIKQGISNLYWFKQDLWKAWVRSGIDENTSNRIFHMKNSEGRSLSKRELMDYLYQELRNIGN